MAFVRELENSYCNCGSIFCTKCNEIVSCYSDNDNEFYETEEEWEDAVVDKSS